MKVSGHVYVCKVYQFCSLFQRFFFY